MKKNTIKTSKEDLIFDIVSYAVIAILVLACFYPMWYVF